MTDKLDVAVIGAGLSGLTAARRLLQANPDLRVRVLEASDRVGGRTLTHVVNRPGGSTDTLDLGAHWVASSQPHIMRLVEEFGIGYYPQNIKGSKVLQVAGGAVKTYSSEIPNLPVAALLQMQRTITAVEKLAKEVDIRDPYAHPRARELDGTTAESFVRGLASHDSVVDIFNAAMQACLGCDVSQISTLFFLAYANSAGGVMKMLLVEGGSAQEFRVKGGTQEISKELAKRIDWGNIALDKPVKAIRDNGETVFVRTADGEELECDFVISAIPFTQLRSVEFNPPLSQAKQGLMRDMAIGNLMKIFVLYEEAFWLEDGFSGEVVSTGGPTDAPGCEAGPLTILYDATTSGGTPALVGFSAGRNADQWFSRSKEERRAAVIKQVVAYFGPKASSPADYVEKNWTSEPHLSGGPVCRCTPGSMHNFHALRKPHGNRVHFAGTEVATEWAGYMSGAVQSGAAAAAAVLEEMGAGDKLAKSDRNALSAFRTKEADYGKLRRSKSSGSIRWCTIL